MFKVKITLLFLCLMTVAGSQLYARGWNDGIKSIDDEAFDAYVNVAQQMKATKHKAHAKAVHKDVFAQAGF